MLTWQPWIKKWITVTTNVQKKINDFPFWYVESE